MLTRRELLQFLAATLGASLLPSCGDSGGTGDDDDEGPPSPNGYLFSPIVSVGDPLPGGDTVVAFLPHFIWAAGPDSISLFFQAVGSQGTPGLYEFVVDGSSGVARVLESHAILKGGDAIMDEGQEAPERNADRQLAWDANASGAVLITVESFDKPPALYLKRRGSGFRHILSRKPKRVGDTTGRMKGVCLGSNDDLLVIADATLRGEESGPIPPLSLLHFPNASPRGAAVLLSTGDPVPGGTVASLALPMLGPNGAFAVQVLVRDSGGREALRILSGHVDNPLGLVSLHHDDDGNQIFHPRISANGVIGQAAILADDATEMRLNGVRVFGTGDGLPSGGVATHVGPPVFGKEGTLFCAASFDGGNEILSWDGSQLKTLLSRGDSIEEKIVKSISFGTRNRQADEQNRIVAQVHMEDGSCAILLGIPV